MNGQHGHDHSAAPAPTPFAALPEPARLVRLTPVIWLPGEKPPAGPALGFSDLAVALCAPTPAPPPPRPFLMPPADTAPGPLLPTVTLARLRTVAVVFGGTAGVAATEGCYVAETLPAALGDDFAAIDALAPFDLPAQDLGGEIVLACAAGADTPARWMAICLPRIALAEAAFPGRFRFLLPPCAAAPVPAAALAALAIGPDRLLPKRPDRGYRIATLFLVLTDPDRPPHPSCLPALRHGATAGNWRIAIVPPAPPLSESIAAVLAEHTLLTVPEPDAWHAVAGAALVFLAPGVPDAVLMAGAPGLAAIVADPDPLTAPLRHAVLGALGGRLAELSGSASEAAVDGGVVLDPAVLAALLAAVPGG